VVPNLLDDSAEAWMTRQATASETDGSISDRELILKIRVFGFCFG